MLKRMQKRLISLSLLFLMPLVLAIAYNLQHSAVPDVVAQTQPAAKVLKVGVPTWPGFGPEYVAYEMGFFQDEGIEVQLSPTGS